MESVRKKIAVIGGGLAASTAIFKLTSQPDWQSKYEFTIYQLGWRIGGKGASGVNPEIGYRIEEHGLHLWMGFYENAFCMMKEVYTALNRKPGAPLRTFDDAFKAQPSIIFDEIVNGKWVNWQIDLPPLPGKVGDGVFNTIEELFAAMFKMAGQKYKEWKAAHAGANNKGCLPGFIQKFIKKEAQIVETDIINDAEKLLKDAEELMFKISEHENHPNHISFLKNLKKTLWDELGELVETDDIARRLWLIIDLFSTIVIGIMEDKVIQKKNDKFVLDFTLINQYDYGQWLVMHGADKKLTVGSPLVRGMYDGPFAFLKGDINKPDAEAGTILNIFLRLAFTCKENVVWKMQAGMGDTIFAPIYQLLTRDNKATFKFFHKVKNLKLSADKKSIEQIEIGRQVTLKKDYNPFINVKGLDCWPSRPNYEYIADDEVEQLKKENINLESHWTAWKDREIITLNHGVDFDEVIIGASLASMPVIAAELIDASTAWYNMIEKVQTVQTQAFQFWLSENDKILQADYNKFLTGYVEPLDTFCAMNQLIDREAWPPANTPKYISYVCGAFPDATVIPPPHVHDFAAKEKQRVLQNMLQYFKNDLQHVMPGAFDSENNFKWNYLIDINNQTGEDRLTSQFYRANIDPSERYVLSAIGSSAYRLKTNESGFTNLYITGDWIQNGLNAGFVEGAVTSGLLTAIAVSGNTGITILKPDWIKDDI